MNNFKNEKLLVIAPHSDDEVLGCGGLISKVKNDGGQVFVLIFNLGFEKNTLVGFGKNMYSWHGVDQIDRDVESHRRSLNIFYELYE